MPSFRATAPVRAWGCLLRDKRGSAAVEFALVLTVLLSLLFGIIGFGFQFAARVALSYAVSEGGRAAVAGLTATDRKTLAQTAINNVLNSFSPLIDPARAVIAVTPGVIGANGQNVAVAITYTDTRFSFFPFLPSSSGTSTVQTNFFVADPSG